MPPSQPEMPQVSQQFGAILLAGAVYPSPLRRSLDVPVLCLPVREREALLDLWLRTFFETGRCRQLTIAVSSIADARQIEQHLDLNPWTHAIRQSLPVSVSVDQEQCRGSGGALLEHSQTLSIGESEFVLVAEASSIPPIGLQRLLTQWDENTAGIVGGTSAFEPAGVYAFCREAISMIPDVKYVDLKEQVLPRLYQDGMAIRSTIVGDRVLSLRTRGQYLGAVRFLAARPGDEHAKGRSVAGANVASSARLFGTCLIGEGATIEDGVILHESIVLPGAKCGTGSVIAGSIIGHRAEVPPRSMVKDQVIAQTSSRRIAS
jgi:hypothetical protein